MCRDGTQSLLRQAPAGESIDTLLEQAGGFGRCQWITTAFGVYLWAVHGGQVMAFVYIGPAVEAEFDDEDSRWLLRLSGSFFFAGWIAGLGLWGWLGSRKGWLVSLASMESLVVLGGCLTTLCTGPRGYLLCRVAVGFAEGGVPTAAWGYASEFLLPPTKAQAITALQLGFIFGSLMIALAASTDSWRAQTLGAALFALPIPIIARYYLPESPRWLLRAGRLEECRAVLRFITATNGFDGLKLSDVKLTEPAVLADGAQRPSNSALSLFTSGAQQADLTLALTLTLTLTLTLFPTLTRPHRAAGHADRHAPGLRLHECVLRPIAALGVGEHQGWWKLLRRHLEPRDAGAGRVRRCEHARDARAAQVAPAAARRPRCSMRHHGCTQHSGAGAAPRPRRTAQRLACHLGLRGQQRTVLGHVRLQRRGLPHRGAARRASDQESGGEAGRFLCAARALAVRRRPAAAVCLLGNLCLRSESRVALAARDARPAVTRDTRGPKQPRREDAISGARTIAHPGRGRPPPLTGPRPSSSRTARRRRPTPLTGLRRDHQLKPRPSA